MRCPERSGDGASLMLRGVGATVERGEGSRAQCVKRRRERDTLWSSKGRDAAEMVRANVNN